MTTDVDGEELTILILLTKNFKTLTELKTVLH